MHLRKKLKLSVAVAAVVISVAAIASTAVGATAGATVDPSNFVTNVDNPYFPLVPGTVFNYTGHMDKSPSSIRVTVTTDRRTIEGVSTIAVSDIVSIRSKEVERTTDFYAQDTSGNVWYFGEDSFDFVKGKWVLSDGSWQAGVDGAQPGIIMEAHPKVGDTYQQEFYAGHAEDMAQVIDTNASVSVPYGSFRHALVTREWTPLEPGVAENKYYAQGVGNVKTIMVEGGDEVFELVSVTH